MNDPQASVLGAILLNNDAYWRVLDRITPDDFDSDMYRRIFVLVGDQLRAGKPADPVTLAEVAGDELGSVALALAQDCYAPSNATAYADIVRERAELRRLQVAGKRIATCGSYDEAMALLASVRPAQTAKVKTVTDGLREMVEALQRRYETGGSVSGVSSGIESLDALTGGWQPATLNVVAGRPSMGKTAFSLQCAMAAGRSLFVSLEMSAGQLVERAVANVGDIPLRWMKFPNEAPDHAGSLVTRFSGEVAKLPLLIDDSSRLTVDAICSRARQAHLTAPLKLVIVDHLGLISRPGKHDPSELGLVTSQLKQLAKDLHLPVILLCQLNRGIESRNDKRPVMADLRDSGRIEEDADTVIGLYRAEYYGEEPAGYVEMIIRKNRDGELGTAWAVSRLSHMRMESCNAVESASRPATPDRSGGFQARGGATRKPASVS